MKLSTWREADLKGQRRSSGAPCAAASLFLLPII